METVSRTYEILADSGCDISRETLKRWGVYACDLAYAFEGEDPRYNGDVDLSRFYQRMRAGEVAKTAAVTPGDFAKTMRGVLEQGRDVVYIGLSSGISGTYDSAVTAARLLAFELPQRKVWTVDSLCASAGYGLLLFLAMQLRDAGATAQELVEAMEAKKGSVTHLFTIDDLAYLKRGGRVSKTSAALASTLNIKPIMHVNDSGKLCAIGKVHGRRKAIENMARRYGQMAAHPSQGPVFISQGGCPEEAAQLARMLSTEYGVDVSPTCDIGPVIGAHSGPGTLALFFIGQQR